ncbi:unnamed protein product [Cunninghamella echinulata]
MLGESNKLVAYNQATQTQIKETQPILNNALHRQSSNNAFDLIGIFILDANLLTVLFIVILGYNMPACFTGKGLIYHVVQNTTCRFDIQFHQRISSFRTESLMDAFLRLIIF